MRRFQHSLTPVLTISGPGDSLADSDQAVTDGEMVFVRSTRQVFVYENPSAQVPDGVTIVKSNFGAGNWILVPTGGGASYSGYYNTASAGALGSGRLLDVTLGFLGALSDGTKVWVRSVRDSYTWYATRSDVADGLLVVNPTSNGVNPGRFIRDQIASVTWETQASWFVGTTGADENSGIDSAHALRTDAERQRRWGKAATLSIAMSVTYLSDPGDMTNYDVLLGVGGALNISGTPAVVKTGAINAVTAQNRGTQTPWSFTSTPAFDGTEVGKLIEITSGARAGNNFWVVKDNTGGSLRTSPPGISAIFDFTPATPVNGDPYSVLTPTHVNVGRWHFAPANNDDFLTHFVNIDGLALDMSNAGGSSGFGLLANEGTVPVFTRCLLKDPNLTNTGSLGMYINGCAFSGSSAISGAASMNAGGYLSGGSMTFYGPVFSSIDRDFLLQNSQLTVSEGSLLAGRQLASFDKSASPAIFVACRSAILCQPVSSTALIWGTNNTGFAVVIKSGGLLAYTVKPTINATLGAGRESSVGGTDKQWGSIPFADTGATGTQAAIVPYS
jgi:hypothetical protein